MQRLQEENASLKAELQQYQTKMETMAREHQQQMQEFAQKYQQKLDAQQEQIQQILNAVQFPSTHGTPRKQPPGKKQDTKTTPQALRHPPMGMEEPAYPGLFSFNRALTAIADTVAPPAAAPPVAASTPAPVPDARPDDEQATHV